MVTRMVDQNAEYQHFASSDQRPEKTYIGNKKRHHKAKSIIVMKRRVNKLKNEQYKIYLSDYKRHIEILGYSKNGREGKYANLYEFLDWLEGKDVKQIKEVKAIDLKAYFSYLKKRPHRMLGGLLNPKTIAHHMHTIRLFFSFLQQKGEIIIHPMSTLKFNYPKTNPKKRVILTIDEVKELYESCEALYEKVILSLAYGCGLRCGEIANVNTEDVKLKESIIIIQKGKGNKRRVVPMSLGVRNDLMNYSEKERRLFLIDTKQDAFLLNIKGDRMKGYTCRKMLKQIVERTGNRIIIEKNIALHNLRHSIATHLLEQGMKIEQVSSFLGHAHLGTTEIYTRISQKQLKKLIE